AIIPPLADSETRFPVNQYYNNSDVVGLVVVNLLFMMTMISFLRASFQKPGSVPSCYPFDPDVPASFGSDEMDKALQERGLHGVRGIERKRDGRARFCRMCGKYKPDRAHHSSNMGKCILEMDHYCPWIRNCVGYLNKKYFFLLITYGAATLIGYVAVLGPHFAYSAEHMQDALDFFVVFSWILALLMGCVVTCFVCFHVWLMLHAFTTIEFCEKRRADDSKRSQGLKIRELYKRSPYDLGAYRNICHVLGPFYLWLLPTRAGMPDDLAAGCIFDINPEHPLYQTTFGSADTAREGGGPASKVASDFGDARTSLLAPEHDLRLPEEVEQSRGISDSSDDSPPASKKG
ncbi:Palmitoyltransferase pfa3 (Protein fatty acyltransferase 3), partial [Durusdinium trenchii]